jgi:folate-dependent tRNA-U54 methylase TrmFO/GidA
MKSNFGILPPLNPHPSSKGLRAKLYAARALAEIEDFINVNIREESY